MRWSPSPAGRLLTRSVDWSLSLEDEAFELVIAGKLLRGSLFHLEVIQIVEGLIWSRIVLPEQGGQRRVLDGLPNDEARALRRAISSGVERLHRRQRVAKLRLSLPQVMAKIQTWQQHLLTAVETRFRARGWLDRRFIELIAVTRPQGCEDVLSDPDLQQDLQIQPEDARAAMDLYRQSLPSWLEARNAEHQAHRLLEDRPFFDTIEKSPLTEEQRHAVLCFDSRVLLVASAGSGKTSVMVAKAAYALKRGYFEPERILMLAFNNDAAAELRQRLKDRLTPHGLPADRVTAKTFHAFGLDVIGLATGKKPMVAPWVESGQDLDMLLTLVDELKDRSSRFRIQWDLFRIVLGQDLPEFGEEEASPESWSRETNQQGFWTLNNEVVKSRGEMILANWLFYNGVRYEYEKAYEHDTADATHRQYRPDFYLPDVNAYLEHWAVDEQGNPPPTFTGYKEGMAWKRALHSQHGTRLLETTMADLWSGKAFDQLAQSLTALGLTLDPNPDRPAPGRQPIENPRLARTLRTFQTHVKNNRLSMAELRQRLANGSAGRFRFRHAMFLDLFEPIQQAWEDKLKANHFIDFEDMLNQAAEHLEQGRWTSPYELIMVDEFQDASHARARLIKALTAKSDTCLFAVGDDWQSINRFAGADLGVMTQFEQHFGVARTLKLETTFRCPQSLCDISSRFVQKNLAQIRKRVRSIKPDVPEPVRITKVDDERQISAAVQAQLQQIDEEAASAKEIHKVYVMGRYRRDRDYFPAGFAHANLSIEFITAHASKGLECDHVILPRMTSETLGFPSRIEDDPVLALAMPDGDGFAFSEERRLFYVALTRAKRTVRLIALTKRDSTFVTELVKDHGLSIQNLDGEDRQEELCPECGQGFLTIRKGKYGLFHGCTGFPRCKFTKKISSTHTDQKVFSTAPRSQPMRRRT
jgi:DNA helicase-4